MIRNSNLALSKSDGGAPVLLSVYDRLQHLSNCVDALRKNPESETTSLYIVSDGPHDSRDEEKIEQVREYICSIRGFKSVKTRFRDTNWGMRASGLDAIEWVFSEHDRLIRMEDDIICSMSYLRFMNEGLAVYEHDNRIFAICGHTHPRFRPPRDYVYDVFLWRTVSPWGFAMWKDRWDRFRSEMDTETEQLRDPNVWKAYRKNRPVMGTRRAYLNGAIHNDARMNLHVFLTDQYSVFPVRSLTRNAGMDGAGTHCALGWTYPTQQLHHQTLRVTKDVMPSKRVHEQMYRLHYSFINHTLGSLLKKLGIFNTVLRWYRQLFCSSLTKNIRVAVSRMRENR